MSRLKRKGKSHQTPLPPPPTEPPAHHRVGDLLWCRENKKRYALWWPAMVTYDPNQAIFTRTTPRSILQVHVQYFGISAVRGWVSTLQIQPLTNASEKRLPTTATFGKKMRAEFDVALQEVMEALTMSHKERKLKFIFSFNPPANSTTQSPKDSRTRGDVSTKRSCKEEGDMEVVVKQEAVEDAVKTEPLEGGGGGGGDVGGEGVGDLQRQRLGKRRRGRRRGESHSDQEGKSSDSSLPAVVQNLRSSSRRKGGRDANYLVVSLNISGLDTPSGSLPDLLVGQPPVAMDSFAVSVDTSLNLSSLNIAQTLNGAVAPSRGRPRRTLKPNSRHVPILGKNKLESGRVKTEQLAGPAKRLALDPGSETGSEASGMNIASAILTPPSSGTEGAMEEDGGGSEGGSSCATTERRGSEVSDEKLTGKLKQTAPRKKPKPAEGPSFRDGECAICDTSDTNLLTCQGHCFQTFHVDCLGLIQPPSFQFVCDECQTVSKQCFTCSKSDGALERCSKPKCSKFYHRACIQTNHLFVFDGLKSKFTCPLHSCAKCVCSDLDTTVAPKGSTLVQCVKCPLALHKPHCLIAGCNLLSNTQMICYLHISIETEVNLYKHLNMDTCLECGNSGSLYCCDFCSSAYHKECMEEHQKPVEEEGEGEVKEEEAKGKGKGTGKGGRGGVGLGEKWICPACMDHDLATYESVVLCKFGVWRWWPGKVVPMADVPDNIRKKKPGEGMFVVRFCGTRDYCWMHHGRTIALSLEPGADPAKEVSKMCRNHGKKGANTDRIFKRACEEAMELYSEQMKLQAERKPLPKQESKAYVKIRTNKYLVQRPTISDDDLHSLPCQCTPENACDDDSICVNRAIHVECDPKTCPVGLFCHNQHMRQCQYADTVPFYTGTRGWGLKAASDIAEGEFVVEYVGEVLDRRMCHERLQKAHETQTQHFYMLTLDTKHGLVIDAKEKSNHARFINHSCDPNCETQKWTVGHESRVGIFANKFIKAGTELTFDYQLDSLGNGKKECLCGSSNCSGYIGVRSKVEPKSKPKPKLKKKPKPASSNKLARPRPTPMDAPPVEVTHENECFMCGDGGDLLCCDFGKCRKVYHLTCLGRKMVPPEKWVCPRHYCTICSKRAFVFCSTCPTSYCAKHRKDKLVAVSDQQKCDSCSNSASHVASSQHPLSSASVLKSNRSTVTTVSSTTSPSLSLSLAWNSLPPPPPPPPPPLPPPPPPLPTPPVPSLPPFPSLPSLHSFSSVPLLPHALAPQPIQLFMPPSNHLLYFNTTQFLSPPSSSLVYSPTFHR